MVTVKSSAPTCADPETRLDPVRSDPFVNTYDVVVTAFDAFKPPCKEPRSATVLHGPAASSNYHDVVTGSPFQEDYTTLPFKRLQNAVRPQD
jgi:hypothetical protein